MCLRTPSLQPRCVGTSHVPELVLTVWHAHSPQGRQGLQVLGRPVSGRPGTPRPVQQPVALGQHPAAGTPQVPAGGGGSDSGKRLSALRSARGHPKWVFCASVSDSPASQFCRYLSVFLLHRISLSFPDAFQPSPDSCYLLLSLCTMPFLPASPLILSQLFLPGLTITPAPVARPLKAVCGLYGGGPRVPCIVCLIVLGRRLLGPKKPFNPGTSRESTGPSREEESQTAAPGGRRSGQQDPRSPP